MSKKVIRRTYRNVKIRSILQFNSQEALPTSDDLSRDSTLSKQYKLNDIVPENKISVTGIGYRVNLNMFRTSDILLSDGTNMYSNYDRFVYLVKKTTELGEQKTYITSPYPFILGGQDFTIEIGVYFEAGIDTLAKGPIFYFSPQNHMKKIDNSMNNTVKYDEYLTREKNNYAFGLSLDTYKSEYDISSKYCFNLKLPGNTNQYYFTSIDFMISDSSSTNSDSLIDIQDPYKNKKLQITIVYKHQNAINKTNPFLFFINGHKGETIDDSTEKNLENYIFNRTGFLYGFMGQYYNQNNSYFNIYFDEFRICDGQDVYSNDLNITTKKIYSELNDITKIKDNYKAIIHFNNIKNGSLFNQISPPHTKSITSPSNKGFDREITFNGNHQYIEYMRDNNLIDGADLQTLTSIEPVDDHRDKYWKSGMNLGGRNFTIESFLKFNTSVTEIKKRTIFEFNEKGCTDPNHYFRMIYDFDSQVMIVEQNNITENGYKELLRFSVPINRRFHWFLCYHHDKKTLKAYIDENEMTQEYIKGLPPIETDDKTDDKTISRIINCGRNITDDVKNNIKKYIAENVNFQKLFKFEHLVLASNVAPMNNDENSYPYYNSYAGTMEEFRLLDGVAAEPYTPEFPYTIYDEIDDWDDEQDYEEDILELNFIVCKELPQTDILELYFEVEKITYTYGPRDILELNFKIEDDYINDNLLQLHFIVERGYIDDDLLQLHFLVSKEYINNDLLQLHFLVSKEYINNDLLQLHFLVKRDYINDNLLKLNFLIEDPEVYGKNNFLTLKFIVKDDYENNNLLRLYFNVKNEYNKNDLLILYFKVEDNSIKIYILKNILTLNFKVGREIVDDESKFHTKRIIPNDDKYLIIAVSFVE